MSFAVRGHFHPWSHLSLNDLLRLGSELHFTQEETCSERLFTLPKLHCKGQRWALNPGLSNVKVPRTFHYPYCLHDTVSCPQLHGHPSWIIRCTCPDSSEEVRLWVSHSFSTQWFHFYWLYTLSFPIKFRLSKVFQSKVKPIKLEQTNKSPDLAD